MNDDDVSHSIVSGKENYGDRHNPFTLLMAESQLQKYYQENQSTITFDEMGFYRLYDPTYPWMEIVAYSFPDVDNLILGTTKNQQGN